MLIYTYKLEKYVKNKLLPKLLLISNKDKYSIKGSFRRRVPYVTDIDVVNNVYPQINKNNIHENLVKQINKISNDPDIILVYITCGTDDRFKISNGSNDELEKIKNLLSDNEKKEFENIVEKYSEDQNKKIFFINELIWEHYKIRWKPRDVLNGYINLPGGVKQNFDDIARNNTNLLLQYYVKLGNYPVGVDVVINYDNIDLSQAYKNAGYYQLQLANYSREFYYMLFPLRFYFKNNKEIYKEIDDIIEKKYGLYKQLMVRINDYNTLYESGNLNIKIATDIVSSIIRDIKSLKDFTSDTIYQIQKVAIDNPPQVKMEDWNNLLKILYKEINDDVNKKSRKYFYHYIGLVPKPDVPQNYISSKKVDQNK
ncbi:nucleotidyl transferase domain containing protein [Moumouvirus maliensis]|nr:nucleotidyl transferase domain containing protein [Moumouvirus maliensis]